LAASDIDARAKFTRKFADAMTVDFPTLMWIGMGGATRPTAFIDDRSIAWTPIASAIPASACRR
jgi:hypothetical protein